MSLQIRAAVPYVPASAPFTAQQRAWLNGYFAGLTSFAESAAPTTVQDAPAPAKKPLRILFGSQSGTAEALAKKLARHSETQGFHPRVAEANACTLEELATIGHLLLVTSTWGDGDPPDNAAQLWSALNSPTAPSLKQLCFSVLALGDRNYADFCGAGRKFDLRLEQLGARRIHRRADCDLDYEKEANAWIEACMAKLREGETIATAPSPEVTHESSLEEQGRAETPSYSRARPFAASLLVNQRLTSAGSAKEVRHFALSLADSGLTYEAGDALGVYPTNCPALVADVLVALGCDGEEGVMTSDGAETSLRHALLQHVQITQPPMRLLEAIAERAPNSAVKALLAPDNKPALDDYLRGREVLDLLIEHPSARFTAEEFVALLRKLNPRLYSIASSPRAHPGEVHLCVGVVRYEAHGRARKGVCSTFLADRADRDTGVPLFVQPSHGFRLPADGNTAVIMVGPGTGIAPFRAFLEERRAVGARGKNWLFFGDQKRNFDFLYREELETMFREGVLTRLDLAFSRDQAEKIYVQHRMREQARELFAWLEDGAHFYVCGDARRMAKDVDAALHEVIRTGGGKSPQEAQAYVAELKAARRYQRDVY